MITLQPVRGTHDLLAEESIRHRKVIDTFRDIFALYGFDEIETPIKIKYTYYAQRNNSPDLDNFVGTVKKFFQDALVESGLIEDDNINFILSNSECYGGIDKLNPRVEAEIIKLNNGV